MEQIASHTGKNPPAGSSRGRSGRGDAAARRAEDYGRLRVARLTKAPRCADVRWRRGSEGNRAFSEGYEGTEPLSRRRCRLAAEQRQRRYRKSRGHRHCLRLRIRPAWRLEMYSRTKKLRKRAVRPLKLFASVNLCAGLSRIRRGSRQAVKSKPSRLDLTGGNLVPWGRYWVRWPDCVTAANRAESAAPRSEPIAAS
jgi:hypothetical protein